MKRNAIVLAAIIGFATIASPIHALAQQGGPGMMGQGSGPGMMGPGPGPGMMSPPGGYAAGGMMGMMGMMNMMGGCPMMTGSTGSIATFADGRIAFLKAELAITDSQKSVWDAYAEAIKRNMQGMQGMAQIMTKMFDAKSPVERLDSQISAMDGRVIALKEIKPALDKLYSALTPDQKKKADELLTGMGCMM